MKTYNVRETLPKYCNSAKVGKGGIDTKIIKAF